jgi:hypothetical protein
MATSHDYNGAITRVAPSGGVTVNTIYADSTDKVVYLALNTALSGASFTAKVEGRVNGVAANTGAAWTAGQPLAYVASSGFTHVITGTQIIAHAAAPRAATATTGDVILCLPSGLQG